MGNETHSARTMPAGIVRKLTAILSADVKGYSRLMGEDEVATIRTLTAYREVMTTLIRQHRGRVVDSPGDNLLAEFASVVDAVQSAVEIQQELRNGEGITSRFLRGCRDNPIVPFGEKGIKADAIVFFEALGVLSPRLVHFVQHLHDHA